MQRKTFYGLFVTVLLVAVSFGFFKIVNNDPTTAVSYSTERSAIQTPKYNGDSPLLGTWSVGTVVPTPTSYGGAGVGYSRNDTCWLYCVNGDTNGSSGSAGAFRSYNIKTNTWTSLPPDQGRSWSSATKIGPVSNTSIYTLGGLPSGASAWTSLTGTLQKYSINTNTWTTMLDAPVAVGSPGLIGYQDSLLFAIGGQGTAGVPITNVQLYNAVTNTWRTATALPTPRGNGWVVTRNDTIYYGCGASSASTFENTIYVGKVSSTDRSVITWTLSATTYPGVSRHRMDADNFAGGFFIGPGAAATWWGAGNDAYTWNGGSSAFVSVGPVPVATSDAYVGTASFNRGGYRVWKAVVASGLILSAPYSINNNQIYTDSVLAPPSGAWTHIDSTGYSLNCVSVVDANVAWIGGAAAKVLKTTNGGLNFTAYTPAILAAGDIYAICGIDANTCLVSTSPSNTFVFKTTDGGTTFTQVFTQVGGFIDDIKMLNATTGFMYGDPVSSRWSLWKTTNAGTTWDSTGSFLPVTGSEAGWNNAMSIRGNTIWFGTNNTKVYKSTNFGATGSWVGAATTGDANSYSVAFNYSTGFTGEASAFKSTDGGATFTSFAAPGTGTIYSFCGPQSTGRFWYCRGASIYNSTDNGATFNTQYTRSLTYQAMDLKLSGTTIRGIAVTNAGVISRYDETSVVTGVTPVTTTAPDSYKLSQNYPNPFNPTTKINFALPKSGLVTLKVYDMLGKEVATLVNEVKNVGTYSVDFNASTLSSGIYFYKVSVNGFSEVKKMMLIK